MSLVMANKKFDVFMSVRGLDTRKTLADHLYYRLSAAQVDVFLDKEKLEKGSNIGLNLKQAIMDSRILIPLFSRNYANSIWCLNEVVHMVESKNTIIPIFYDVEPQEVRYQKGPFAQAFQQHENCLRYSEDTIHRWRKALHEACSFSGWSLRDDFDGYEGKLVNTVTSQILKKLQKTLRVPKFSVGLEEHISRVINLLKIDSDEKLKIVGIYGMGGTGKTTLAMAVFNNICSEFNVRCFLPDVRKNTHTELRRKIIRHLAHKNYSSDEGQILMEPEIAISITDALLVLDDLDDRYVLEALRCGWFHLEGRVLITTRDKGVLDERLNDVSYQVDELNYDQALRLFNWHTFSREVSEKNYQDLTEKVVKACQGLPLTIEVIGRLLCDKRDPKIWTDVIKQLKNCEITQIEDRLRISYNDLNETEKDIFLDIACFFIGSEKFNALSIWESSGLCANLAIHNLQAKSLIKFTSDDRFQMHDILRDMGRALVRKQNPDDPGKRSRIWDEKEVRKAFKDNMVTRSIQGIQYDSHNWKEWSAEDLEPMQNLRLLSISNTVIKGDFQKLSSRLRWLRWKHCSLDFLPVELKLKNLAVLELPQSSIKQVWDDDDHLKVPKYLKVLNLRKCSQLERLPDFYKLQSLVKLELSGCIRIKTLPSSVGSLEKLEYMDLSNCENLMELPHNLAGLLSLKKLNLSHCRNLTVLPGTMGNLTSIRELIFTSTSIAYLPDFFAGMFLLQKLSLSNCTSLKRLPNSIGSLHSLHVLDVDFSGIARLPEEIGELLELEELNLSACNNLMELPESLGNLKSLRILRLNESNKLNRLPGSISGLRALQALEASDCGLKELPAQFVLLRTLEVVHLQYNNFCTLPKNFKQLNTLTTLILHYCEELLELPVLPGSLVYVDVSNCKRLRKVSDLSNMKSLETLMLHNCENLERISGLGSLQVLGDLNITGCKNINNTHVKGLDLLKSLERLHLGGTRVLVSNFQEWAKGRELILYGHEIPDWLDHQMQTRVSNYAPVNFPLMEIRISMDQNVRCIGVIFCFLSYGKETGIDATVTRGGLEISRIHIVRNRGEDGRENGRDEIHLFICHKNHDLVRSLQDGDRIHIWAHPLHPYPQTWVRKGGVHLLYRREDEQKQLSEKQAENNLYQRLFLDLTWIQWSWLAWNNLPIHFDIHHLAAHDLAGSFISRKTCTYSLSLASQSWGQRFSSKVFHVEIKKTGMKWNTEECFDLETLAFAQIEAADDERKIIINPTSQSAGNPEGIDASIGRSNNRTVDIYVGNRWLDWRRLLADGRSELEIELGVRARRTSTANVQVKILSINTNSIWEHGPSSSSSRTLRQSHSVLTCEEILSAKKQYLLL